MKSLSSLHRQTIWVTAVIALILTFHQDLGHAKGSKKVDPRLKDNSSVKFFSKSGGKACASGAALGAATCLFGGGDKAKCMAVRAAGACAVAMTANYYLDKKRAEYANTEDFLDAVIADVQKDNEQLKMLTQTAESVLRDDKAKIAQIKEDIATDTLKKKEAKKQLQSIDANTAFLQKTLEEVRDKKKEWQKVADAERGKSKRVNALDAEINKMQLQIVALEAEVDQLYEQRSAIQLT
jgi:prefoldin subunit 5